MATYLQGVQDKVTQIKPPQPNLQFESQMLTARQSKYDQGHKQLSEMYGKILNSGLTRDSNVQARDEFFKLIDSDLRKIAGVDLSKQSNVVQGQNVFSQIYENDYLVKDMVWTKNFENQVRKAEQFKNCIDPKECGGSYWDGGMKYLQYQKQEFSETDNNDSLRFQNAEFVPYQNIAEDAMKVAKDSGISIKYDEPTGNYITTHQNGEAVLEPLTTLFSKLYKDNPAYQKQFEVQSYNERKDWASSMVQSGKYQSMQEAEVGYIKENSDRLNTAVNTIAANIGVDNKNLDNQIQDLIKKRDSGNMKVGSSDHKKLIQLQQLKPLSDEAKHFSEISKTALKNANNHSVIRNIGSTLDRASGMVRLNNEINQIAELATHIDEEHTVKVDELAKMKIKFGYDKALEYIRQEGAWNLQNLKHSQNLSSGIGVISNVNKVDKVFKQINGSANLEAMFKADAAEKFPTLSAGDLTKLSNSTNHKDRKEGLEENAKNVALQKEYIAKQKALTIDGQLKTDAFSNALNSGPNKLWQGTGSTFTPKPFRGGGGGGFPGFSGGGFSGGAAQPVSYTGGNVKFNKPSSSQTAASTPRTTTKKIAKSDPELAKATLYRDIDFAAMDKDNPGLIDEMVSLIADTLPDSGAKDFYTKVADKGFKNSSAKSQKLILEKMGSRLDKIGSNLQFKVDGWSSGLSKVDLKGDAQKEFEKVSKPALAQKLEAGQRITTNYMRTVKKGSDEETSMRSYMQNFLIQNGEISKSGMLKYNGQEIGYVYNPLSDEFKGEYNKVGHSIPPKNSKQRKGWLLNPDNVNDILSLENMKSLVEKNQYLSSSIAKNRILNKVSESQGNYFSQRAINQDGEKLDHTHYEADMKAYMLNDKVYSAMQNSRKLAHDKIVTAMQASEAFGEAGADATNYVKDGKFVWPKGAHHGELNVGLREAYKDAMDKVYAEGELNVFIPGAGSRIRRDMNTFNPDMSDLDEGSPAYDIRNYLKVAKGSSSEGDVNAMNITVPEGFEYTSEAKLLNDLEAGKYNIVKASFNPLRGVDPTTKNEDLENKQKQDWSRLSFTLDDGSVIDVDLNNAVNDRTLLLNESDATPMTKVINRIGKYEYNILGKNTHLQGPGNNPAPVMIQRENKSKLSVTGKIYDWDPVAEKGIYLNIQDELDKHNIYYSHSPEFLENILNAMFKESEKVYNEHAETVK